MGMWKFLRDWIVFQENIPKVCVLSEIVVSLQDKTQDNTEVKLSIRCFYEPTYSSWKSKVIVRQIRHVSVGLSIDNDKNQT